MNGEKKHQIPEDRPAFHVDKNLKAAAIKAAEAFIEEEEELRKLEYAQT